MEQPQPQTQKESKPLQLVWIDLEMSCLELDHDTTLEIACCITDSTLKTVHKGPNLVIRHPPAVIEGMGEWCREHHGKSGLSQAVLDSTTTMKQAETIVLDFIKSHIPHPKTGILAGNSVHMDKEFLRKDMPQLLDYLHYRIIDTSTLKELCRAWNPSVFNKAPVKKTAHRALDDILESIAELQYYKDNFIRLEEDLKVVEGITKQ